MLQLNNLTPLVKKRKRVGRGGKLGTTAGRGSKGQKARSGGGPARGYEGGQMPLARRLPKRGFNNKLFATTYEIVCLADLERQFTADAEVTLTQLVEKALLKNIKSNKAVKVKILGDGELTKRLVVIADAFSQSAKLAIQKAGGEARLTKES
ncbi:MAG TPA: 50S ribosomal protein L15 [Candidatus Babeliales bacterium]|nr:50S ribosomal protein L15 [Candidatus Babeliales bacterium]